MTPGGADGEDEREPGDPSGPDDSTSDEEPGPDATQTAGTEVAGGGEEETATGEDPWKAPGNNLTTVAATSVAVGGTAIAAGAVVFFVRRRRRLATGVHEDDYHPPYLPDVPEHAGLGDPLGSAYGAPSAESSVDAEYEYYARQYPNPYGDPAVDELAGGAGRDDRVSGIAELLEADTETQEPVRLDAPPPTVEPVRLAGPVGPDDPEGAGDLEGAGDPEGAGGSARRADEASPAAPEAPASASSGSVPSASPSPASPSRPSHEPYKRPKPVAYDRSMEAELAAWEPEPPAKPDADKDD